MEAVKRALASILVLSFLVVGCGGGDDGSLTVYSGRSESLVGPLIADFEESTGIDVNVRYAGSTELAATLLEEGGDSPADVFFAQDPASLGAVGDAGLLATLPQDILDIVPAKFSDGDGRWVGVSGRARVLVYSTLQSPPLPTTVDDLLDESWKGRLGIAPGNGSFLSFVAASILLDGEEATRAWLDGIAAGDPVVFEGNSPIVAAVDAGEVEGGLVNHYYLLRLIAENGSADAANLFFDDGGPGALVMPAGVGIIGGSARADEAERFIEFLLAADSQAYFATETFEYPLLPGIAANEALPPIDSIQAPVIDLGKLGSVLDIATDLVSAAGLL